MPDNYVIKANAKASLHNKWPQAIGIGAVMLSVFCLFVVLLNLVSFYLTIIFSDYISLFAIILFVVALSQFFVMPLLYGILRWFWFTAADFDVPISEIFCYFANGREYLRAFSLSFRIFMRSSSVLLICFLPSLVVVAISSPTTYDMLNTSMPYWASYVWALGNTLTLLGTIMSFVLLLRYFAAPILMINDPSITPHEALDLSVILTKSVNGRTISFVCSFIGWFFLLLFYLPIIFVLPYFLVSYAVYCRFLINHYNRQINAMNQNPFKAV